MDSVAYNGPDEDVLDSLLFLTRYIYLIEFQDGGKGYYLCELLDLVQCSRDELLIGLQEICACCIDGKLEFKKKDSISFSGRWRMLSFEYETRVLSMIINLAEEKAWTEIPKTECIENLESSVPKAILEHIFSNFTNPISDVSGELNPL